MRHKFMKFSLDFQKADWCKDEVKIEFMPINFHWNITFS